MRGRALRIGGYRILAALTGIALSVHGFESPSTPTRALAAFQHDPGLRVELVAAEPLVPDLRRRLVYLEQTTRDLYHLLNAEPNWSALASLADNLLAHETLEEEEVTDIVNEWLG